MGNISSKPGDGDVLQLKDQNRFSIASVVISNFNKTLLHITPNSFPATRYNARREAGDDSVVDYIQDPESTANGPPSFLLRLSNEDDLTFTFTFIIRQSVTFNPAQEALGSVNQPATNTVDTAISNLTYICGSGTKELEQLINVEFHADPNLHRNPKVQLVGDYTTGGSPSVQAQWTWKWKPPKVIEDRGGGWRNSCSFVEYDQRAHRLNTLATFSFWVQNNRLPRTPNLASPLLGVETPQRLRLPSNQSLQSRISESDGFDTMEPQSPMFDPIPENSLGIVPSTTNPTMRLDVPPTRGGEEASSQEPNDLLFQAAKRDFEQRSSNLRHKWKRVLKKADSAYEAQQAANIAKTELMDVLKETFASSSSGNAQPSINTFFEKTAKDILSYERSTTTHMRTHIIDPIQKLYNTDIKQAEARRKDFDEKEKEYNAWVRWYLGKTENSMKEKKGKEIDSKYQTKKKYFELKRFDYSSFIEDLQGGRKDQEVFSHLFQYADAQTKQYLEVAEKIEQARPQRDALRLELKQANDEYDLQRRQREEKRRALETSSKGAAENGTVVTPNPPSSASQPAANRSMSDDATPTPAKPLPAASGSAPVQSSPAMPISTSSSHEKEGVLYALSRPGGHSDPKGLNKQAWHKFWIVLNQGKLLEYSNWKVAPELQLTIDLRVANVRVARDADRRFCFEVKTPLFTRIYQDTSDESVKSWITAMNNAIQNALETQAISGSKSISDDGSDQNLNIATALTGKPSKHYSLSNHRSSYQGGGPKASGTPSRYNTIGGNPTRPAAQEAAISPLLQQLRDAEQDNLYCADCGTADKNDWVSINLGIIICFHCSGVHRSLSRDISKVNSLTLDTTPFTPDAIELLLRVGNRASNTIWEAKLDRSQKIGPFCTEEQRKTFIIAKYKKKAYVRTLSETMPHVASAVEPLVTSVKKNELHGVLYALAVPKAPISDADDNAQVTASIRFRKEAVDPSRKTSVVYLALAAADPAAPGATASPLHSPNPATSNRLSNSHTARKLFTVAELLLQNGFEIPLENAPFPLSPSAQAYLDHKKGQRAGVPAVSALPVGAEKDGSGDVTALPIYPGTLGAPGDRSRSDGKLQKRISTSGKLTKQPGP